MQHFIGGAFAEGYAGSGGGDGQQSGGRADPTPQIFIGKIPKGVPLSVVEAQLIPFGASNVRMLEGKGCAFANFESWAAAERAISSLNGVKLAEGVSEGINVKLADQKGAPKGREGKPKIFIGGLVHGVTEDQIYQVCSAFGSVMEAKVHSKSASSPVCGFATFASFTEAEVCVSSLHGQEHEICTPGKTLNVRFADPQQSKGPGSISGAIVGGGTRVGMSVMQRGVMPGNAFLQSPLSVGGPRHQMGMGGCSGMTAPSCARPGNGTGPLPPGASQKIFIGSLPDLATEDFVWGMMAPFGEVVEAKLHRKAGAAPCGFVRFSTPDEANVAVTALSSTGRYPIKFADDKGGKRTHQMAFHLGDVSTPQGYQMDHSVVGGCGGQIHPQAW
jgi:RNA recognition motif-containing protein